MESMEQFKARQAAELAKKERELEQMSRIGDVPGLTPFLIHSGLYGWGHIAYKLVDLKAFVEWAKENCVPVHAVEGRYKSFLPEVPENRNYEGANIVQSGEVKVTWNGPSWERVKIECYINDERGKLKISFDLDKSHRELAPSIRWGGRNGGGKYIENWTVPANFKRYVRTDGQHHPESLTVEYLMTWHDVERLFIEEAK